MPPALPALRGDSMLESRQAGQTQHTEGTEDVGTSASETWTRQTTDMGSGSMWQRELGSIPRAAAPGSHTQSGPAGLLASRRPRVSGPAPKESCKYSQTRVHTHTRPPCLHTHTGPHVGTRAPSKDAGTGTQLTTTQRTQSRRWTRRRAEHSPSRLQLHTRLVFKALLWLLSGK